MHVLCWRVRREFQCFQDVAMGDVEAESPIWVQFKIGAAVRKKSRVDDEIRDF